MAAEIDPVVLKFFAENQQFKAELRATTRTVDQQLGLQEARVRKLESEFRRSSGAISSSLKGLAATLAASFTGRELVGMIDNFTRLQNSLRVAGLEGEALAEVQGKLFDLAAKNGVAATSLADLYGKSASAAGDLGASQAQLLQLTENTALALRVSGVSAEQASGAILGLTQALSSGTVRAEEFNQANEGGLRPLLQAAVASGQFGGSVAKLRNEIVAGNVSSKAFFGAVLEGSNVLRDQAAGSVLTISGAITALNQRLTEYVGSNASATGATGLLSGAIQSLAENVEDLVEIAAVVAVALGTRFAAGAAVAATQAIGLRAVALGLAVQLNGTAAAATLAGRALLTAMTGPVGVAIGAVAVGLALVASNSENAASQTRGLGNDSTSTASAIEKLNNILNADPSAQVAKNAGELARQRREQAKATYEAAAAEIALRRQMGQRKLADLKDGTLTETVNNGRGGKSTRETTYSNRGLANQRAIAQSEIDQANRDQAALDAAFRNAKRQIANPPAPARTAPVATARPTRSTGPRSTSTGGPSGPTAAEMEARFQDELASIQSRILSARATQALSAEQRASFEREQLRLAEEAEQRRLAADKDLTDVQRAQLFLRLGELSAAERRAIAFREQAEIEQRNADLADERGRAQTDALRLQFDLATTDKDRRRIALDILKAEQAILREKLLAQINSKTLNDVDKERARIQLAALDAQAAAQQESVDRQYASPLQRYAIDAQDTDKLVEEAAVRRIEQLNETITDAMTNALGIEDPFLKELISIFLDKNIFGPLAEALNNPDLQGNGGGIIAGIGSFLGGLFGRASGGRVNAGSVYRVNEGASPGRVEAFRPDVSGQIIPLGRMNAMRDGGVQGGGGVATVRLELSGDIDARIERVSGPVAIEVVRQTAPQIVDAASNETLRRASRPSL